MSGPRRLWPLCMLAMLVPLAHADDSNTPAKKPAPTTVTPAAKSTAPAKAAVPGPDDELLEFLGSVGEDSDGEWIDYLSKTDISKVTRARKEPAATEVSK